MLSKNRYYLAIKSSNWLKKELKRSFFSFFLSIVCTILLFDFLLINHPQITLDINKFIQTILTHSTNFLLNLSGFDTYIKVPWLAIQGYSGIEFAPGCLGLRHIVMFGIYIACYFGKPMHKLIYLILGTLVLTVVNVMRAYIISIGQYWDETKTDLIHDIASPLMMYVTILMLWILWMNHWGNPARTIDINRKQQ